MKWMICEQILIWNWTKLNAILMVQKMINIVTDNYFHLGWMDSVLGSDRRFDDKRLVINYKLTKNDIESYNEGYQMSVECNFELTDIIRKMRKLGQILINHDD